MKNKVKKIISGKGFYIISALGIISAVMSVAIIYRTVSSVKNEMLLPQVTTVPTQQAQIPQSNVPDPRTVTKATTHKATEKTTEAQQTSQREESTALEPVSTTLNEEEVFSNDEFIFPLQGEIIKEYSPDVPVYDETMGDWRTHKGVDYSGEQGEDVCSVGNGQVKKIISDPSFGYIVEVDYGSFTARYCGLEQGTVVHAEKTVKKGDVIGKLGSIPCEGEMETHLHFEVICDGVYNDPLKMSAE